MIYADLWTNRPADPGEVIIQSVRAELSKHAGVVARIARSTGLEKISIAGALTMTLDRVDVGGAVSLSTALSELSDETKKPIVLMIDEAQYAISTKKGTDALFALKAARDELNSSLHHGLRVIATGSSRDKLAMLRNSRDQAFYQAPLQELKPLGREFIVWRLELAKLPVQLAVDEVFDLFAATAHRPEIIGEALDNLHFVEDLTPANAQSHLHLLVDAKVTELDKATLAVVRGLTSLQLAVLRVMAAQGDRYAPFGDQSMASYRALIGGRMVVTEANVQQALQALQKNSLVWRAARGIYALEEASLENILRKEGMLDFADSGPSNVKSPV